MGEEEGGGRREEGRKGTGSLFSFISSSAPRSIFRKIDRRLHVWQQQRQQQQQRLLDLRLLLLLLLLPRNLEETKEFWRSFQTSS